MYNNSSNPFPSSIHGFPPPSATFYGHEKDGVYFHHHPFVAGDCSATTIAPPAIKGSEVAQYCEDNNSNNCNLFSDSVISNNRVAGSKKDRHSKIFTAQGPRDRRVRLSIDISRKFFGLQDLLGFDKASKTLDWLFTKSKTAIKDLLEEMKQNNSSSSTLTHQCEEVFMGGDHVDNKKGKKSKKQVPKCGINGNKRKSKKTTQKHGLIHVNLAARSQSRAEARARARERTIEKLQKLRNIESSFKNVVVGDHHHQNYYFLQSSQSNQEVKIGDQSAAAAMEQKLNPIKPYSSHHNSCFIESKDSTSQFKNTIPIDQDPQKD